METFEDFKNNFNLIESRLNGNDQCDPTDDLVKAKTWIDYVQNPTVGAEVQHLQHLVREGLPKIVRAVLKRRYANNKDEHIHAAVEFLKYAAAFAASVLQSCPDKLDGQFALLSELFQPKQPFYQKYGHPKPPALAVAVDGSADGNLRVETSVATSDADQVKFLNDLEVQSVFDYQYTPGEWELAIVETMTEFRDRINISVPGQGKSEWLTISVDSQKMAPFGTKVKGINSPLVIDVTTEKEASSSSSSSSIVASTGTDSIDAGGSGEGADQLWRFDLCPGTLVDAKDLQNTWYQACIMEIKHEQVPVIPEHSATMPKGILKTLRLKGSNSSSNPDSQGKAVSRSGVDWSDAPSALSGADAGSGAMELAENEVPIDLTEQLADDGSLSAVDLLAGLRGLNAAEPAVPVSEIETEVGVGAEGVPALCEL